MTSVQSVRSVEDLAISSLPTSSRVKFVSAEFVCGPEKMKFVVRVPETEVADFCLNLDVDLRLFNTAKGFGTATEKPEKKAVLCRRAVALDTIPPETDVVDVTAKRLVELVTAALKPSVH